MKFKILAKLIILNPLVRHYLYAVAVFFSKIGKSVSIGTGVYLRKSVIGDYCSIGMNGRILNSTVGRYTYFAGNCSVDRAEVGSFSSIGQNVVIGLGRHPIGLISTHPVFYSNMGQCGITYLKESVYNESSETKIGPDVWIGANVLIMSGVVIGVGAIIGAGSIVTKDVAPYSIVVGAPAKPIKFRFDDDTISKLIKSKWWERDDLWIKNNLNMFSNDNWIKENLTDLR